MSPTKMKRQQQLLSHSIARNVEPNIWARKRQRRINRELENYRSSCFFLKQFALKSRATLESYAICLNFNVDFSLSHCFDDKWFSKERKNERKERMTREEKEEVFLNFKPSRVLFGRRRKRRKKASSRHHISSHPGTTPQSGPKIAIFPVTNGFF